MKSTRKWDAEYMRSQSSRKPAAKAVNGIAGNGTAYSVSGPEEAPVVALIHGLGLCRELWAPLLPGLSRYRIVNYDLYGHGQSHALPAPASLKLYADQLAGLLDELRMAKACVVGFSIGGMINRRFALDHPQRTTALAILNSPHDRGEQAQREVEARAQQVRAQGTMATLPAALQRWFTPSYLAAGDGPELVTAWRARVDPQSYAEAAWVLANGVRELIDPPTRVAQPVLVMSCENDTGSTPAMAVAIANDCANACVQIVPGLQHLGIMEAPDAFLGPLDKFLSSLPGND